MNQSQFLIYISESGSTKLDVRLEDDTVWLSQKMMAELYQTTKQNINLHIQNIYEEGELTEEPTVKENLTVENQSKFNRTVRNFRIVQQEGKRQVERDVAFYNLDMILSVGYRIKSSIATKFRQWATEKLKEYIIKGFVLDDERLKNPDQPFDYFEELIRRIQDIRTSEKRFYQKITDIYATSVDYDPTQEMSILFFKTVQNKMHWAITGKTAAEIIHERADSSQPNMGLTNWRGEKIRKQDVSVAKNYLNENELLALNNLVEQYLVFAEGQAMRRIPMYMQDWITKLNGFLSLNDREILDHAGKISHELAVEHSEKEYNLFHQKRMQESNKKESDFDKAIQNIPPKKKGK